MTDFVAARWRNITMPSIFSLSLSKNRHALALCRHILILKLPLNLGLVREANVGPGREVSKKT